VLLLEQPRRADVPKTPGIPPPKKPALYLRISTANGQTTKNQHRELNDAKAASG
jgi:hypothetical protein